MKNNQLRQQRISAELQELRQQPNLMVIDCQWDGLLKEDFWVLWVKGRQGTCWFGMVIPVQISFPDKYPIAAPLINFPKDFQHIHVYEGGQICMPILQNQHWKPKSTMAQLIKRIDGVIHQEINPYSPANHSLYTIYKSDKAQYDSIMQKQKQRYRMKDPKYYKMACVHIDICGDENK